MNALRRIAATLTAAILLMALSLIAPIATQAQSPSWLSSSVIYCVNPEIFSTSGLSGVTSQLTRIHNLGCNVIWLMPFYPRGVACTVDGISHPSVNSPYCINNMEGIASNMGTSTDMTNLVTTAHGLGMKVIIDLALNQTSWDNPLVTSNPGYYLHSDGNPNNVASIEDGWNMDTDIAQFNLTTNTYGVQTYVTNVCKYWVQTYNIDGFRFDSADDPSGSSRSLPASLAQSILSACETINPNIMLLGEEEDVSLALAPYDLDYGWNMWFYGVVPALTTSGDELTLQYQWEYPYTISNTSPATMLHMNVQDDWDYANRDNVTLGGYAQAMAAGVWDFSISGVPMMYNGMEVANTNGGNNSHTQINWTGTDSAAFSTFYTQLLALRNAGPAMQQGSTAFISTSSSAVIVYTRSSGSVSYLIEINTNGGTATGTFSSQSGTWTEVTPTGAPGGKSHPNPSGGTFSLQGYDFAIFQKGSNGPPSTPTGLTATAGSGLVNLSWTASSGATSYNIYRGTTSGGESTTPIATGVTSTSFSNTGLTAGTTYYFEVAAVNSSGTSGKSNEASATPTAPTVPPAPTGLTATSGNAQISLSWSASSGATSYNVYRGTSSGGESSTAIATGITSTSYTNTGLTNGTKYYYEVAAVNVAGTSGKSNEASATPAAASLSGTVTAISSATNYNLTSTGTTSWAAWGMQNPYEHISSNTSVSDCTVYGSGSRNGFSSGFLGFTWTNGTPNSSETNESDGFYNSGVGNGFQFTVPAGTSVQHLTIYVGGYDSNGTLTATLSDGSAPAYTDSSQTGTGQYYAHYDLTYNSASAGQTLTVVWKMKSGSTDVRLLAAALH